MVLRTLFGMLLLAQGAVVLAQQTPVNFKVAFFGDQGMGSNAEAVLKLAKAEGAQMIIHLGDFDYEDNPDAWEAQNTKILGPDFPQAAVIGNHDVAKWTGYAAFVKARSQKFGVTMTGDIGRQYSFKYKGIFFVFTSPKLHGSGHDLFIKQQLEKDNSIWRVSNWHVNQNKMQAGTKGDEAGWGVFEESRMGGAIMAQGHEHSYCRTHLLSNFTNQTIVSKDSVMRLKKGQSFTFVNGLGGVGVRAQTRNDPWMAKVYTTDQSATYGVVIGTFNVNGQEDKADFYFKDIKGKVVDKWTVISEVNKGSTALRTGEQSFAMNPRKFGSEGPAGVHLVDLAGRTLAKAQSGPEGGMVRIGKGRSGVFVIRSGAKDGRDGEKIVVLP